MRSRLSLTPLQPGKCTLSFMPTLFQLLHLHSSETCCKLSQQHQYMYLYAHSQSCTVVHACRYCNEPSWHNFSAELQKKQLLFFPASLYLSLLQQGIADLGMVSLLILDGVHQAVKDQPTTSILQDHYFALPPGSAPKVCDCPSTPSIGSISMCTLICIYQVLSSLSLVVLDVLVFANADGHCLDPDCLRPFRASVWLWED